MNSQKVEQSIKEILDKCGEEILQNHSAFQSAVFDLLDKTHYAEEQLTLKHAMDSSAFWMLLGTSQITADRAKKAAAHIQKESRMTEADAKFVVQCVIAARGGNPDIVAEDANRQQGVGRTQQKEEKKKQKKHQKKAQENKQKQGSQEQVQTPTSTPTQVSAPDADIDGNKPGLIKRIVTAVIFSALFWIMAFAILYLADEMDIKDCFVAAVVLAIPVGCWMQKVWNMPKKKKSDIVKGFIFGIVWGVAALLVWYMVCEGIHSGYIYGDEYWSAYEDYFSDMDYDEYLRISDSMRENNYSFYYNGRTYGLTYGQKMTFYWGLTIAVSILFIFIQNIVWKLIRKRRKNKALQKGIA